MNKLQLEREWILGEPLKEQGAFGRVFEAASADGKQVVVKLIPKDPRAEREINFPGMDARNVVPVIDSGEYGDDWAIVMPRADKSLRQHLKSAGGRLPVEETAKIIRDISVALSDLDGGVVHRDLKPENVLLLDGTWCLADFGMARFADAETETLTWKMGGTSAYIAPERWRLERATISSDVYSLGVIAYELLTGKVSFPGPDFRHQHLHAVRPSLTGFPALFAGLVEECLLIAAQARPLPANLVARLDRLQTSLSSGLAALAEANHAATARLAEEQRRHSEHRTEEGRRADLFSAAQSLLARLSETFLAALVDVAPTAAVRSGQSAAWAFRLGDVDLRFSSASPVPMKVWRSGPTPFDVIAYADISLRVPANHRGYQGRSHSLWYCDAQVAESYGWFETAFTRHPAFDRGRPRPQVEPFSLAPESTARAAVASGTDVTQVAWPFVQLDIGDLGDFISRWAQWLAEAFRGQLNYPSRTPERPTQGTWR